MKGRAVLLLAATVAVLLAGCGDDPPPATGDPGDGGDGEDHLGTSGAPLPDKPAPVVVGPAELEAGHYYAFRHAGGDLALAMAEDGTADLVLFGADDGRIGRIALAGRAGGSDAGGDGGEAGGRFVLDGIPAGELVVHAVEVDGRLDLRSGGVRVGAFERLPSHVERHVLLQMPYGALGPWGLPPLEPASADQHVSVELRRAPSALRALLVGNVQGLVVELRSRAGPVLEAADPGAPFGFAGPGGMHELPGEVNEENVRDGRLEGRVAADHFEGVLLLEAESFSRARPPASGGTPTGDSVRFTYGVLPDQPVSFRVRSGADRLFLFHELTEAEEECLEEVEGEDEEAQEACEPDEALVALFGPRDERVATVRVPWNRTIAVPVHASGEWVAVLLDGEASLGADRAPSDFELHPLDVRTVMGPTQPASDESGRYGQAVAVIDPAGVAFRVEAYEEGSDDIGTLTDPQSFFGTNCGPSTVAALQDSETIGAWSYAAPGGAWDGESAESSLLLDGGKLTLVHDDFGPGCLRTVVYVDGYVR